MTIATTVANEIIGAIFGDSHIASMPASFEIGLSSTNPGADGSNITEPVGNGYARPVIANTTAAWGSPNSGGVNNQALVAFAQATGAWPTVSYWVLFNASDHSFFSASQLNQPTTIVSGDTPQFPPGSLVIDESSF